MPLPPLVLCVAPHGHVANGSTGSLEWQRAQPGSRTARQPAGAWRHLRPATSGGLLTAPAGLS